MSKKTATIDSDAVMHTACYWLEKITGEAPDSDGCPSSQVHHAVRVKFGYGAPFGIGFDVGMAIAAAIIADPLGDPTERIRAAVAAAHKDLRSCNEGYTLDEDAAA